MFRKLTVLICLLSFCPAAFGAQELAGVATPPPVVGQQSQQRPLNLNPPAGLYAADTTAAAEEMKCSDSVKGEEPKKVKSSLTFSEWSEIHFGDYRWVWWVGGAAVLGALHVFAFSE